MEWKLKDYLEKHDITPHRLALEAKLSVNSVYPIVRGTAQRISLPTLERLLTTLDRLSGERVELSELLDRAGERKSLRQELLDLAGSFDDPDSPGDVAANHDRYLDAALLDEHKRGSVDKA